jgi:hypothetical protein
MEPIHIAIMRPNASTILASFASVETACYFAILYNALSTPKELTQIALYDDALSTFPLSERGTVLVDPAEALTLYGPSEPFGYLAGESESIWQRDSRTHAELDAELDAYMIYDPTALMLED